MLKVDLRQLRDGVIETNGTLSPDDEAFLGLDLELEEPVAVTGRLQETGEGEYFWHASLTSRVLAECRRCLVDVHLPVTADIRILFSSDRMAAEDPGIYALPSAATRLDLGEAVREEIALAVPKFVLCREGCAGLCPQCGTDLNAGPCSCAKTAPTT